MSDDIHLTLSRADAETLADLADTGLDRETRFPSMDGFTPAYRAELDRLREDGQRVIKLIYAALNAAPAYTPGQYKQARGVLKPEPGIEPPEETIRRMRNAAPAEGPERAATGEMVALLVAAVTDVAEALAAECGDDEKGESAVRWCFEHSGSRRAEMLNAYLAALRAAGEERA